MRPSPVLCYLYLDYYWFNRRDSRINRHAVKRNKSKKWLIIQKQIKEMNVKCQ